MKAFHNDPRVKEFFLARVTAHKAAGQIVKGVYWRNGCGCAVGCTIHSSSHLSYPGILGIPVVLAHLEDRIFEGLPLWLAKDWPGKFLSAIPVGANLSQVWPDFVVWRLADPTHGVIKYVENTRDRQFILRIAQLHKERCLDESAFRAAGSPLMSASCAAQQSLLAADAAARTTPEAATVMVVAAAEAAGAAADHTGREPSVAKDGAYVRMASKLLELLRAAPVK